MEERCGAAVGHQANALEVHRSARRSGIPDGALTLASRHSKGEGNVVYVRPHAPWARDERRGSRHASGDILRNRRDASSGSDSGSERCGAVAVKIHPDMRKRH